MIVLKKILIMTLWTGRLMSLHSILLGDHHRLLRISITLMGILEKQKLVSPPLDRLMPIKHTKRSLSKIKKSSRTNLSKVSKRPCPQM